MTFLKKSWTLLILIIVIVYAIINKNYNVYILRKKGEIATGIIYNIKKVGSKGDYKCSYNFIFKNIEYKGKVFDYFNEEYKLYDSIEVILSPSDPSFNRARKYVDEFTF